MKTSGIGLFWMLILILWGVTIGGCKNATVEVTWSVNPLQDHVAGYLVYYGTASGKYIHVEDVGQNTQVNISNLQEGVTYYFAVTAYDTSWNESVFSEEVTILIPFSSG
jgi:hypothetical protein